VRVLITGVSGFIGSAIAHRILRTSDNEVIGLDISKRFNRNSTIELHPRFTYIHCSINDPFNLDKVFNLYQIDAVIHLAALTGVRGSFEAPMDYIQTNILGFQNVMDSVLRNVSNFTFTSSSSVLGDNGYPISPYALTKKTNEGQAQIYYETYGLKSTGFRPFTVYGPDGRRDMAVMMFAEKIVSGEEIVLFNNGEHSRSFTYIDDLVDKFIHRIYHKEDYPDCSLIEIAGANRSLLDLVNILETELGVKADIRFQERQPGDVVHTSGTNPICQTTLEVGLHKFADWLSSR